MEPLDRALEDFFRATEVPEEDNVFFWRVIEEYERQTRGAALAWKALQAGCALVTGLAVLAALAGLEPGVQSVIAEAIRGAVLVGALGTTLAYAGRTLSGSRPHFASH
jgi:hypothetical protein